MTDPAPADELPTSTVISRVVSYSVAVLGGLLVVIASYSASNGDWLAPMSFRDLIAVPMWVPFGLGILVLIVSVSSLIGPVRILARRARARRGGGSAE